MKQILVLCLVIFYYHLSESQQRIEWAKAGNGFWHVALNWTPPQVPGALDTVIIEHDSVAIRDGISAEAARVVVASNGSPTGLGIVFGGSLTILGSNSDGLDISGEMASFENAGQLTVSDVQEVALLMDGVNFHNTASGQITIKGPIGIGGIQVKLRPLYEINFINEGEINITEAKLFAIDCDGAFKNFGSIYARHCLSGIGTAFRSAHNYGTIKVDSVDNQALIVESDFTNHDGAEIFVDSIQDHAIIVIDSLINHGDIDVKNIGERAIWNSSGHLVNHKNISLTNHDVGIFNFNGKFFNLDAGKTLIDSSRNQAIISLDSMFNQGLICIRDCQENGISNQQYIYNEGKITIFRSGLHGIENDRSFAKFINADSIVIDSCDGSGIRNLRGFFSNQGNIQIHSGGAVTSDGVVVEADTFSNIGMIHIEAVQEVGLAAFQRFVGIPSVVDIFGGEVHIVDVDGTSMFILANAELKVGAAAKIQTTDDSGVPMDIQEGATVEIQGILEVAK